MKIALLVEGPSDKLTLPILAKKVAPGHSFVARVLGRGNLLNAEKVFAFVEYMKGQDNAIRKVLLCVDSECTPEAELLKIVSPQETKLKRLIKSPLVMYCGVIHATEAWLAGDASALKLYLNSPNFRSSAANAVSKACKPKQALAALFDRHGREFVNTRDNPKLAQGIDVGQLIKTSQSFARFARLVR